MKKFLRQAVRFAAAVFAIVMLVHFIYAARYKADPNGTNKFRQVPQHIQLCNFGNSHSLNSIDYSDLHGMTCFNFALSSQSLSYDYRLLQNYQEDLEEGCVVLIGVSYFSLYGIPETEQSDFASKNSRYYRILSPWLIKEFDFWDFALSYFPELGSDDRLIRTLRGHYLSPAPDEWFYQTADDIDLARNIDASFLRHYVTNRLDDQGRRILNEEELESLYDMISLCRESGFTPVLVTFPLMEEYTQKITESDSSVYRDFYQLMDAITADTGVPYFDYSTDHRFASEHTLFKNGDHLNHAGAKKFTQIILDEILPTLNTN